jgi:dGTPase
VRMTWKKLLCDERPRRTTSTGDHRAQFERDFDRSVFSTPVKRLQDKAQVFPLEPHDAVRTPLTHSLEVSSVARGLGIAAGQWLLEQKEIDPGMERWIEAIAATCGLIHDLGNPPFGHSGENAIRDWFASHSGEDKLKQELGGNDQLTQDFLKFEGNAQSLRLVSKLQILADYNGLNLTFATLSASCKYTAASNEIVVAGDHAKSKPGYFASENNLIKLIRENTGTGNARHPLTFLVEAADDIVYSVADLEDAVKKGVLKWRDAEEWLRKKCPDDQTIDDAFQGMDNILKAGAGKVPEGLPGDVYASAFRTAAIGIFVKASMALFQARYDEIMDGLYKGELVKDCSAANLLKQLKSLGKEKIYCTQSNLKLELMGRHIIHELMDLFWEGASNLSTKDEDDIPDTTNFPGKIGALLSENYRRVFRHFVKHAPELPEKYHRFQLVTDYVCGMTDSFAKRLHNELCGG